MIKTKIKKAIAIASIAALAATTLGSTFAADIGTASIDGGATSNVVWDDTFGNMANATGSVNNVIVTAQILPTLNMVVSTGVIDLGILTAGIESNDSLDIEVGTNAANGVTITARSGSGWLTNTSDNTLQINDLVVDGIAESYTFTSATGAIDSTITGFESTVALTTTEVNENTSEHAIYSTNKPEQDDGAAADVTFTVAATSNAQTAAGNYEDTITFTVTGNF